MKNTIGMIDQPPSLIVDVQLAVTQLDPRIETQAEVDVELKEFEEPPGTQALTDWAQHAYASISKEPTELTIRVVDENEIQSLNREYRHQDKPTNVLSFPVDIEDVALLGDIVVCHSVVVSEAQSQNKSIQQHYAHMVTHGVLHLCGYDHQNDQEAEQMESLEVRVLAAQGIANPYL